MLGCPESVESGRSLERASLDKSAPGAQHTPMRLAILNSLLLVGCASTQVVIQDPAPINSVVYTAGPHDKDQQVYVIMVNDIVPSFFRGEKNTSFIGEMAIEDTGQGTKSIKEISELLKPWTGSDRIIYAPGTSNCLSATEGMPTVMVDWAGGGGSVYKSLSFDYGCAASNPELAAALRSIPAKLGVEALIGPPRRR